MPDATHPFHICRNGQQRALRAHLVELIGADDAAAMSDGDVKSWFIEHGYTTVISYSGEYDDADDILVVETDELAELVHRKKAFWLHR